MISILRALNRLMHNVEAVMTWAAVAVLAAMMLLVNLNVFIRPLGMPIWGVFEIVGFLGALLISFALIHPTLHGDHLSVDLLVDRLPEKVQGVLAVIKVLAGIPVFGLMAWYTARYGFRVMATGQVSGTLKLPLAPILWGIAAAFGIMALVSLLELFNQLLHVKKENQ